MRPDRHFEEQAPLAGVVVMVWSEERVVSGRFAAVRVSIGAARPVGVDPVSGPVGLVDDAAGQVVASKSMS